MQLQELLRRPNDHLPLGKRFAHPNEEALVLAVQKTIEQPIERGFCVPLSLPHATSELCIGPGGQRPQVVSAPLRPERPGWFISRYARSLDGYSVSAVKVLAATPAEATRAGQRLFWQELAREGACLRGAVGEGRPGRSGPSVGRQPAFAVADSPTAPGAPAQLYVFEPYVEQFSLDDMLRPRKRSGERLRPLKENILAGARRPLFASVLRDIGGALAALALQNVLHGLVEPGHIVWQPSQAGYPEGHWTLTDFSVARRVTDPALRPAWRAPNAGPAPQAPASGSALAPAGFTAGGPAAFFAPELCLLRWQPPRAPGGGPARPTASMLPWSLAYDTWCLAESALGCWQLLTPWPLSEVRDVPPWLGEEADFAPLAWADKGRRLLAYCDWWWREALPNEQGAQGPQSDDGYAAFFAAAEGSCGAPAVALIRAMLAPLPWLRPSAAQVAAEAHGLMVQLGEGAGDAPAAFGGPSAAVQNEVQRYYQLRLKGAGNPKPVPGRAVQPPDFNELRHATERQLEADWRALQTSCQPRL